MHDSACQCSFRKPFRSISALLHCANFAAATEDLGLAMRNAGVLNAKSSKRQSTKFESRLAPAPCHNFAMMGSRQLYINEPESISKLTCQRCQGRPG